ncbi:unnamed protein product [Calypogeia fissa]
MPSLFALSSSFSLPTMAVANSSFHGFRKATTKLQKRARGVSSERARRRGVTRNAESERSENYSAVQQKDGSVGKSKLRITNAPGRSRSTNRGKRGNVEPLVQERVNDDLIRRYWLDEISGAVRIEEVNTSGSNENRSSDITGMVRNREPLLLPFGIPLPKMVTDFILPGGFPDTVSNDYLQYMLWQFPTNVTGWICSTIVTSSLFKAVGVGLDGGYAAAATATIKWVSKDGLGALGLVLIGGRFGSIFDEDPKQWRLYADIIGSAGGIFELCTPLAPDQFLLLGSLGYLLKAVAKGLKDPSFRVIQNHFAIAENVGDVSAKEEVWEVSAKLLGLSAAVLLLGMPVLSSSYWKLVLVWTSLRSLHIWLRYKSLSVVQFPTINYKRAAVLIKSNLQGDTLPGCNECNKRENLLVWWQLMSPRVRMGCSLKDLLESSPLASEVEELLGLYTQEDYVLVLHPNPVYGSEARILAKEGATSMTMLRSLWQAYWLLLPYVAMRSPSVSEHSSSSPEISVANPVELGSLRRQSDKLHLSLDAMNSHFDSFLEELERSDWDLDKIALKVPNDAPRIVTS